MMSTGTDQEQQRGGLLSFITKDNLKAFLVVNLGLFLLTVGVYFFKIPNNFTTGGVSGLSIILGKVVPFLSTATLMAIINVLLLVLGYLFLGKTFGFWTTYCSLMYSFETWVLERVCPMDKPFTDQPLMELFFAMMLPAVGSALLFNYNASSGGTDIVAMILKKYTGISDIGKGLFVSDSVIALSSFFFFGVETGMFSILGLFLKAFVVDSVIESINLCKFYRHLQAGRNLRLYHQSAQPQFHGGGWRRGLFPPEPQSGAHRCAPGRGCAPASKVQGDRPSLLYVHY